jgi:molecular chaperone DnaJ
VRIRSEGEPPPPEVSPAGEGIRGDLHVVVRVLEHERFKREANHLVMELPVPFAQAALGAELEVETLDAREKITVPHGTQHGDLFRVHNAGLPDLRTGKRGDLVAVARIEVPRKLSKEQDRLLREYAATENLEVSPESQGIWKKVKDKLTG